MVPFQAIVFFSGNLKGLSSLIFVLCSFVFILWDCFSILCPVKSLKSI